MKKVYSSLFLVMSWMIFQYWPVTVHVHGKTPEDTFQIRMPLKDKRSLDYFFRYVFFLGVWGYTTIGSKPMSVDHYTEPWAQIRKAFINPHFKCVLLDAFFPPRLGKIYYLFYPEQLKIKRGWEALNKYIQYFPHSRFTIFTYHNDTDNVCLVLVDKIKLIETIQHHIDDFRDELLLQEVTLEDLSHNEKLYLFLKRLHKDRLIGIVLGYGRENARLFEKYKGKDPTPMDSMWPGEDEAWLEGINQKDLTFKPWDASDLFFPRFSCDPQSEETRKLKEAYLEEKEKIIQYYDGKDIVEATFSLFYQKT